MAVRIEVKLVDGDHLPVGKTLFREFEIVLDQFVFGTVIQFVCLDEDPAAAGPVQPFSDHLRAIKLVICFQRKVHVKGSLFTELLL
ncbi:MAG: hypothetical protein RL732_672 [Bacteroidota bacterium]